MRKFASLTLMFLLSTSVSSVYADRDLDALLGGLSFGNSQLVGQTDEDVSEELLPTPRGEIDAPVTAPQAGNANQLPINPGPPLPAAMLQDRMQDLTRPQNEAPAAMAAPMTPRQSEAVSPTPATPQHVDFGGLLQPADAPQQMVSVHPGHVAPAVQVNPHVGGHAGGCDCGVCQSAAHGNHHHGGARLAGHRGCGVAGCGCRGGNACDGVAQCRPHTPPVLPPPSTILQYFNSRGSHNDVWAGYEREAQLANDHAMKHVHGNCDCFKEKGCHKCCPPVYRGVSRPVAVTPPCDSTCD